MPDMDRELHQQFKDAFEPSLDAMQSALDHMGQAGFDFVGSLARLKAGQQAIRVAAAGLACHAMELLAQRLGDYISDLTSLELRTQADVQVFLDRMREVVSLPVDLPVGEVAKLLRGLPVHHSFDVEDIEIRDVEVLLVTPSKTVARMAGAEIAACGFRVHTCYSPVQAFVEAMDTRPDFVVATLTMEKLSGVDLVRALKATSVFKDVPMAIMTSRDNADPALTTDLPPGVVIVNSGTGFATSFAEAVTKFNLG